MTSPSARRDEWVFFKNVGEGYELDILTTILEEAHIPVMSKSRGSGAYTRIYMGASISGYDLYVPSSRLTEAEQIIDTVEIVEPDFIESTHEKTEEAGFILRYRPIFKNLLLYLFVVPVIITTLIWAIWTVKESLVSL